MQKNSIKETICSFYLDLSNLKNWHHLQYLFRIVSQNINSSYHPDINFNLEMPKLFTRIANLNY